MQTSIHKFNAENWTGDEMEIKVSEFAGVTSWEAFEETYSLTDHQEFDMDDPKYGFQCYTIRIDGRDTGWKVGKFNNEDRWEATDDLGDFSRQGSNAAIAAMKLAAMCH